MYFLFGRILMYVRCNFIVVKKEVNLLKPIFVIYLWHKMPNEVWCALLVNMTYSKIYFGFLLNRETVRAKEWMREDLFDGDGKQRKWFSQKPMYEQTNQWKWNEIKYHNIVIAEMKFRIEPSDWRIVEIHRNWHTADDIRFFFLQLDSPNI